MEEGSKKYLLDSSAWLAFLKDEEGADRVEELLRKERIILPFMVLLELYYITFRERGAEIADKRYAMIKSLNLDIHWKIDEPTLMLAGRFKAQYKISLADAIIAAFAKANKATLVHKDPEYEALREEVEQLTLL